jgi:hypothetical protein
VATAAVQSTETDVVRPMPRRRLAHTFDAAASTLPMARRTSFHPGIVQPGLRLLVWLRVCLYFFGGNAIDFCGRDSLQRRAVRLRRLFDSAGGSFGKLAQQLAQRADLLPYAYCVELSKILDQAPVIPTADAIAIIEREVGRPFGEVFGVFDPVPIGSASIACIPGGLRSGERGCGVQRPAIGRAVGGSGALDWLLILAEALTIVRPGLTGASGGSSGRCMGELNFGQGLPHGDVQAWAKNYGDGVTRRDLL